MNHGRELALSVADKLRIVQVRGQAVVLDGANCRWSHKCIGLPSVVKAGNRLALFYDAPGGQSTSHMRRNVGLAWLELPLRAPGAGTGQSR